MAHNDEYVFLWDENVEVWTEFQKSSRDIFRNNVVERLLNSLSPLSGKTILDIGSGSGAIADLLSSRGASVVCVDLSENMIKKVKASSERNDYDILCQRAIARFFIIASYL